MPENTNSCLVPVLLMSSMSKLLGNGVQIDPNKMEIENSMRLAKMKHSG
jgi:hypothetical protein